MTYSIDFRKKVLKTRKAEGLSIKTVSVPFSVGQASVMRWLVELAPKKTRNKPAMKIDMDALKKTSKNTSKNTPIAINTNEHSVLAQAELGYTGP